MEYFDEWFIKEMRDRLTRDKDNIPQEVGQLIYYLDLMELYREMGNVAGQIAAKNNFFNLLSKHFYVIDSLFMGERV